MKLVLGLHPGTESYSLPILKHGGLFNSPFWDLNSGRSTDSRTWVPRAYNNLSYRRKSSMSKVTFFWKRRMMKLRFFDLSYGVLKVELHGIDRNLTRSHQFANTSKHKHTSNHFKQIEDFKMSFPLTKWCWFSDEIIEIRMKTTTRTGILMLPTRVQQSLSVFSFFWVPNDELEDYRFFFLVITRHFKFSTPRFLYESGYSQGSL